MLNKQAPHGQVFGMAGVAWEQAGQLFDFAGYPVDGNGERIVVESAPLPSSDTLEGMHWKRLQVMLEQYGETYTTREAAVAFLRGRT